ncbi:MAG: protein jag [Chloroflexi bacterium]|nr:protein jag [Chloroflexota bacterium]
MPSVEKSGRTVEEAIELALADLGNVSREKASIEVISEGRGGLLGIGAEEAKVRVTVSESLDDREPSGDEDIGIAGEEELEKLLALLKVEASVELETASVDNLSSTPAVLNIRGPNLALLIGRRGETLSVLQYVVNLILSRRFKRRTALLVDVDGYRQRRQESLRALALRAADQVKYTNGPVFLEAMPSYERRIIHLALQDRFDVISKSVGEGEQRKVVISPKQ